MAENKKMDKLLKSMSKKLKSDLLAVTQNQETEASVPPFEVGYWKDEVGHWEYALFDSLKKAKDYAIKINSDVHYWYIYGPETYIEKFNVHGDVLHNPEAW